MRDLLIVGFGSIGRRHAHNLRALGVDSIVVYDTDPGRRLAAQREVGARAAGALADALDDGPTAVLVCTPPDAHTSVALEAVRRGCHLFIEKPLAHEDGPQMAELLAEVRRRRLVTLVGCNLRFHHGPRTVKRLLDDGAVGAPVSALLDAGQYLPDWHPGEDYRRWYSAHRGQGGGVTLDGVHEIDYARWLLGEITEVFAYGGKFSSLEVDVEDCVNLLVRFAAGFSAHMHLDYIQRVYARSCKVIGEDGTVVWDIADGPVRWYSARTSRWRLFRAPATYSLNEMYRLELQHWLACLRGEAAPVNDLFEAWRVTRIALAVRRAMATGLPQPVPSTRS
jgi:predicted dehydrogenase